MALAAILRQTGYSMKPASMSAPPSQPATQRRWRRWLFAVLILLMLPVLLSLSRAPEAEPSEPPSAAEVRNARWIYERVVMARQDSRPRRISLGWNELATVAELSGRAAGIERVRLKHEGGRLHLTVSRALFGGFWLNIHGFVVPDAAGHARISARIGHLPVAALISHALIGLAERVLRARDSQVPTLDQAVQELRFDSRGISAVLNPPANSRVLRALAGLRTDQVDVERITAHYCRLVATRRTEPPLLSGLVNQAFAGGDGSVADNQAIFIALSVLVAQIDAGALPQGQTALYGKCGKPSTEFVLQGRADLAKHWTVSAAIAAYMGTGTSAAMGIWKEISDSGEGGSGFSLVDLAADRSGTFSAQRGADEAQSHALQQWLARASNEHLLPVTALALAEGMTEEQFRMRYSNTDSDAFAATVNRIDSELAVLMR